MKNRLSLLSFVAIIVALFAFFHITSARDESFFHRVFPRVLERSLEGQISSVFLSGSGVIPLITSAQMSGSGIVILRWAPIGHLSNEDILDCPDITEITHEYITADRVYQILTLRPISKSCIGNHRIAGQNISIFPKNFFQIRGAFLSTEAFIQQDSIIEKEQLSSPVIIDISDPKFTPRSGEEELIHGIFKKYAHDIETSATLARRQLLQDLGDRRSVVKYISPVSGYKISLDEAIIPGARRDYRRDTTDGVHHGWDIFAPVGTPVVALDDGYIIRKVSHFHESDFARIQKGRYLSPLSQSLNLDIFRGNQVWLLTKNGEVVFYSHLSDVSDVSVGEFVSRGDHLGSVGVSGVPGKNYKHSHLHFEIQSSPILNISASIPTKNQILSWNWIARGASREEATQITRDIFSSGAINY